MLPPRPVLIYGNQALRYPVGGPYTYELELRAPEHGNSHSLSMLRVQRNTEVFRDPNWPSTETRRVTVRANSIAERDEFLEFCTNTLGQEIEFLDHEGRTWIGIITNPNDLTTDEFAHCGYILSFEFMVTGGEVT